MGTLPLTYPQKHLTAAGMAGYGNYDAAIMDHFIHLQVVLPSFVLVILTLVFLCNLILKREKKGGLMRK